MIRVDNGNYALTFLKSIGKNNVTKERLLLPIPQTEMDSNHLMTQNPVINPFYNHSFRQII